MHYDDTHTHTSDVKTPYNHYCLLEKHAWRGAEERSREVEQRRVAEERRRGE
jgi:hypothetical protein